ncbi:MAG: hypothetical protein WCK34_15200 [Bacteroidota bacterium]
MKSIKYSILILFLVSISGRLVSQDALSIYDKVYGLDQALYNGKKYNYFLPPGTIGHQYILSPGYIAGSVTIKGKCYGNVSLNFDIFNQQLLLKYADETGSLNIIELSKAWLEGFSLGNMNFELLSPEKNPCFFQVLGDGPLKVLYYWRKNLNLVSAIGSSDYTFTRAVRDSFVLSNGQLKPFRNKRGLVKLFDRTWRPAIKSYLRKNRVDVKKAPDQAVTKMINFIGTLK